jgi:hypothetical protein
MNREELFQIHKNLCKNALELMQKKNHDYSGKGGNEPFANFTRAEAMGITTTEKGIMVRLLDKMSRLSSFLDSKEFKVKDEKLEDTIVDMINYSVLLYAYIQSKKTSNQMDLPFDLVVLTKYDTIDEHPYDLYSKGGRVPNDEDTR